MEKTSQHYWTKQVCPLIYSHATFSTNRRFLYYLHQLVINIHGSSVSFPRQKLKLLKNWLFSKLWMAPFTFNATWRSSYAVKSYDLKKVWDGLSSTSPKEILKLLALLSIQDRTALACSCMEKKVTHWRHFNGAPPWCSRGWSTPPMRRPRELDTFKLENNWIWRRHKSNFPVPMRSTFRWLCQALHSCQVAKRQKTMALSWNKRLRLDIRNFHTQSNKFPKKAVPSSPLAYSTWMSPCTVLCDFTADLAWSKKLALDILLMSIPTWISLFLYPRNY